ncbi:MAG: carboxypeptidase regulatory-like domain-containing protein [Bryobacteraceae bacterium]
MLRAAVFLLITPLLAVQDQQCAIEGTVLNAKTSEPIKKVEVALRREDSSGGVTNGVLTDGAGKFKFADLEPARYYIWMSKSGFLEGPRRLGDASHVLALAEGQTLKDLTYRLWPTAVIAGRVVDEDGNPMTDVSIMTYRYRYEQGRLRVFLDGGVAQTDDQGRYRMYGVRAGRWYLGAKHMKAASHSMGDATGLHFTDSARDEAYTPLYYPGVADAGQAAPIQLRAGEQRRDVDFRLVPARTVRVRGRVAPLPPPQELSVLLMARGLTGPTPLVEHRMAGVDEKGLFEIRGVFPGSYLLLSMSFRRDEGPSARQRLEVGNTDVDGVEVTLRPSVKW